ncbi:MAG: hypothetical protein ABEI52_10520, partial [Halobacteriaceae archaeon]
ANPSNMDEILDAIDILADFGLEGVFTWALRILGIIAVLVGVGLWAFANMDLLVLPAALIVAGVVLLIIPGVLLEVAEMAG